jgi:CheY-like chemotaxis protein
LHGGRVNARSDGPGQGSQFEIQLPVAPTAGTAAQGRDLDSDQERHPPRRRILVVDDNLRNASSMELLLEALGQDVYTAHDGQTALKVLREFRPDVVFLDIGLPGMDGYDVAKLCRMEPGLQNLTLVAMTGYGKEEDRRRSQASGFNAHLVKPVNINDLRLLLNQGSSI